MAKILIVDDEPRIRELIREHLQYAGYVCEEAGDGSAALSLRKLRKSLKRASRAVKAK